MPEQFQGLFEGAPPPDYDPNAWTHIKFYDLAAWRALKGWDKNSVIADAQIAFNPDTLELTITSSKPLPRVGAVNHDPERFAGQGDGGDQGCGPAGRAAREACPDRGPPVVFAMSGARTIRICPTRYPEAVSVVLKGPDRLTC